MKRACRGAFVQHKSAMCAEETYCAKSLVSFAQF